MIHTIKIDKANAVRVENRATMVRVSAVVPFFGDKSLDVEPEVAMAASDALRIAAEMAVKARAGA